MSSKNSSSAATTGGSDGLHGISATAVIATDLEIDVGTLSVDADNNRVGIGTTEPSTRLQVDGVVTSTGLAVDSGTLSVDSGNNRVGIGTTEPDGALHVMKASAGSVTASGDGNAFVVEADDVSGVTLLAPNEGVIYFGDVADNDIGRIRYNHATDSMRFWTNNAERVRIESDGKVGIGTADPGTQLQMTSTAPYATLQNSTAENSDGGCESKIIFEDHADVALAQVEGSHSGSSDDTKGKLILSTHTGSALTAGLTINESQQSTFTGDVVVTGTTPKITIGDAGTEDTMLVFDGSAVDFRMGIYDSGDRLEIGKGTAHNTTPAIIVNSTPQVMTTAAFGMTTGGTFGTFSDGDATPSVVTGNLWKHHASTQTITMFDDGVAGQVINVISTAAITYDVTSTNLKGGSVDLVTASGDVTQWFFDGTNWYLTYFMDVSADHSVIGGGGADANDSNTILHMSVFA